jgi:hypothetical protein
MAVMIRSGLVIATLALLLAAAEAQERPRGRTPATRLVNVQTDPVPAACRIVDGGGAAKSHEFGTPASVPVERRARDLGVLCKRDGYQDGRGAIAPRMRSVKVTMIAGAGTAARVPKTIADVHPHPQRLRLSRQAEADLVWLRERFETGALSERDYFQRRRELIVREAKLAPARRS